MPIRCYRENGENPVSQPHPASHKSKIHGIGNGSYELYNSCSSSAAPTTVANFKNERATAMTRINMRPPNSIRMRGGLEYYQ
ncbi:hypothetical protein ACFX15_038182 [Malus domestica]